MNCRVMLKAFDRLCWHVLEFVGDDVALREFGERRLVNPIRNEMPRHLPCDRIGFGIEDEGLERNRVRRVSQHMPELTAAKNPDLHIEISSRASRLSPATARQRDQDETARPLSVARAIR